MVTLQTRPSRKAHEDELRRELIDLWSKAGLEIDELRLKLFDGLSPALKRAIVDQVRAEVSAIIATPVSPASARS
jgi:hypothetical protein